MAPGFFLYFQRLYWFFVSRFCLYWEHCKTAKNLKIAHGLHTENAAGYRSHRAFSMSTFVSMPGRLFFIASYLFNLMGCGVLGTPPRALLSIKP